MSDVLVRVGSLSDFPEGSMKKVQVNDKDVLVANLSSKIYAIGDSCTHRHCSLSEGTIEGNIVICPCHEGRFDLTTGKVIASPPKSDEPVYEVKLQGSDVMLLEKWNSLG
jgi:nitrite reductase/ring-hydroxylating ferredoxin subunit